MDAINPAHGSLPEGELSFPYKSSISKLSFVFYIIGDLKVLLVVLYSRDSHIPKHSHIIDSLIIQKHSYISRILDLKYTYKAIRYSVRHG